MGLQSLGKAFFHALTIYHHKVVERFGTLNSIDANLATQSIFGKDVHVISIVGALIAYLLYYRNRLFIVDNVGRLTNKLLGIHLKLVKCCRLNAFQNCHDSFTGQPSVGYQSSNQVVCHTRTYCFTHIVSVNFLLYHRCPCFQRFFVAYCVHASFFHHHTNFCYAEVLVDSFYRLTSKV